jgi:hypothetical protein
MVPDSTTTTIFWVTNHALERPNRRIGIHTFVVNGFLPTSDIDEKQTGF